MTEQPDDAYAAAKAAAQARADAYAPGPYPSAGQTWVRGGQLIHLLGRTTTAWVVAPDVDGTPDTGAAYRLDLDEHAATFTFRDCRHDPYCCAIHGHHATPHQGCILR